MHLFTTGTMIEIALELVLGVCIKLFCDNGRIHWRDLANDFLFWVPGVGRPLPGDGLSRQVAAMVAAPPVEDHEDYPTAIAAK